MKARHASEVAAQKAVWRQLAAEREKVWSDYRKEFATPEAEQDKADQQTISSRRVPGSRLGTPPNRNTSGRPIRTREMEPTVHRPPKNQPGGTGAPDGRRRNAKPMDRTKSETEARMTAAAAGSAIGTTTIDVAPMPEDPRRRSLKLARFAKSRLCKTSYIQTLSLV